jgi:hypothetical protein
MEMVLSRFGSGGRKANVEVGAEQMVIVRYDTIMM